MNTENLEKKKFIDLLRSNTKVLSAILIILILTGSFFLWLDYSSKNQRVKISEEFISAKVFLNNKNLTSSLGILKKIINKKDKIYSPLSLFLIIDNDLESDKTLVLKYFDTVLSIGGQEKEDLNLLKLKKAYFISENSKEKDLLDLLNPIINSKSVWRIQSIKFLGDYYFSLKEFKKAGQYYSILLAEENLNIDISEIERKMKIIKNA